MGQEKLTSKRADWHYIFLQYGDKYRKPRKKNPQKSLTLVDKSESCEAAHHSVKSQDPKKKSYSMLDQMLRSCILNLEFCIHVCTLVIIISTEKFCMQNLLF